jgi:hypothetical protein
MHPAQRDSMTLPVRHGARNGGTVHLRGRAEKRQRSKQHNRLQMGPMNLFAASFGV